MIISVGERSRAVLGRIRKCSAKYSSTINSTKQDQRVIIHAYSNRIRDQNISADTRVVKIFTYHREAVVYKEARMWTGRQGLTYIVRSVQTAQCRSPYRGPCMIENRFGAARYSVAAERYTIRSSRMRVVSGGSGRRAIV